jgi:hypothetical protein
MDLDLPYIVCVCKQKFNKTEFKKHHKNCKDFKEIFNDFDLRIGNLLKEYLLVKENSSIIKFLFQRYIKLIDHKFKTAEIAKINAIRKKRKNRFSPSVLEKKIEIRFNLVNEIKDDDFLDRLSFNGDDQNNNKTNLYPQNNNLNRYSPNNSNNGYPLNNNINNFQLNNNSHLFGNEALFFGGNQPNNNNNMLRSSPIQNNNFFNIQNSQFNNFGQNIGKSFSFNNRPIYNFFEQGYNSNNDIYSKIPKNSNNNIGGNHKILKVGSQLEEEDRKIICNFCRDEFKKYGGRCNSEMIKKIGWHMNRVYPKSKWFILIYNNEDNEIYDNLSPTLDLIPERYMNFTLGKLIVQFKEYKKNYLII